MEKQLNRLQQQLSHLPDSEWDLFTHFCTSLIVTLHPDASVRQSSIDQWYQSSAEPIHRIHHLLSNPKLMQIMDQSLADVDCKKGANHRKNSDLARIAREHGNRLFLAGDYLQALKAYNCALLFAPHANHASNQDGPTKSKPKINTLTVPGQSKRDPIECAELSLAYGNRSAALFQLAHYERALVDIELALENGYPTDKRHVLFGRRLLCLRALGKPEHVMQRAMSGALQKLKKRHAINTYQWEQAKRYLQICYDRFPINEDSITNHDSPANDLDGRLSPLPWKPWDEEGRSAVPGTPFISPFSSPMPTPIGSPEVSEDEEEEQSDERAKNNGNKPRPSSQPAFNGFIEDCVEIRYDAQHGRHLVAKHDLQVGQLILSEPAFVGWLRPSKYHTNCFECHVPLAPQHFVPCRSCNLIRYCSSACAERSWTQIHHIECPVLPVIGSLSIGHLALRMLWKGGIDRALELLHLKIQDTNTNDKKINSNANAVHSNAKNVNNKSINNKNKNQHKNKRGSPEVPKTTHESNTGGNDHPSIQSEMIKSNQMQLEQKIPLTNQTDYELIVHLSANYVKLPAHLAYNYVIGCIFLARLCQKLNIKHKHSSASKIELIQLSAIILHHMLQVRCNARASEAPVHLIPEVHDYAFPNEEQIRQAAKQSAARPPVKSSAHHSPLTKWTENQLRNAVNSQMIGERCSFGVQMFARLSLVNHGCLANTYTKKVKPLCHRSCEMLELRLCQKLNAGDQLLLNYGCAWQQMSVADRRGWLLSEYGFECQCSACEQGWQNWPQALHCDQCGGVGGAAVVMDSSIGQAQCIRCGWKLERDQLEQRLHQVDSLRKRIERLVQLDDRLRTPEQASLLYQCESGDSNATSIKDQVSNERRQAKQSEYNRLHDELVECLNEANRLLYRDHDLMLDLHELSARSFERINVPKEACRHWIAVFASNCLTQGQTSYDALMAILELSRMLCTVAANENQQAAEFNRQMDALIDQMHKCTGCTDQHANRLSSTGTGGTGKRSPEPKGVSRKKSTRKSAKHNKPEVKTNCDVKCTPAHDQVHDAQAKNEERLEQLKQSVSDHYSASESARRAASGYFEKALNISKDLQLNEHQLLLSNANCIQRCVDLLQQLNSLFNLSTTNL